MNNQTIKDFQSLKLQDRIEITHEDGLWLYQLEGAHYLTDVYMLHDQIVTIFFHRAELKVVACEMLSYSRLDILTEEISLPYSYKVKKK